MENFPLKEETYKLIGACMQVQNTLGYGFLEIIYKDAMEVEFINNVIPYKREQKLEINYKGKILPHQFYTDFTVDEKIIVEVKSCEKGITSEHIAQTLNYLRVSGFSVALIVNFGKVRLEYKRLVFKN